jgi:hypothetical protein
MLPAIVTPNDDHVDAPTHERARPQARGARPRFWRTLAHKSTRDRTPTPRERHMVSYSAPRLFETPMDRLVREHPSLSVYALALI